MIKPQLTLPKLGLVVMTRVFLGAGVALIVANRMSAERRKAVGWTLAAVGALTTVPLALDVFTKPRKLARKKIRK